MYLRGVGPDGGCEGRGGGSPVGEGTGGLKLGEDLFSDVFGACIEVEGDGFWRGDFDEDVLGFVGRGSCGGDGRRLPLLYWRLDGRGAKDVDTRFWFAWK